MEHETGVDAGSTVENLYGCYLLYCTNPKFKGHTYIGYTVNPSRRIRQHNCGVKAGGAKRTSKRGPWEMALLIYGFPNSVSALKFEWAWQNPKKSRRLRHVDGKSSKETAFQYRFRVMCRMLQTGPWKRLPLVIRWLKQEYFIEFQATNRPPSHMPIVYGTVLTKKVSPPSLADDSKSPTTFSEDKCAVCDRQILDSKTKVKCLLPTCSMQSHVTCLARVFAGDYHLLPIDGSCPVCRQSMLWGDLIRHKNGCYQTFVTSNQEADSSLDEDHWSVALRPK